MSESLVPHTPDGLDLSMRASGDRQKPKILFVHGLGQCCLSSDRQIVGSLSERFGLVTYELRGHDDSHKPAERAAYSDGSCRADDLQTVIKAASPRRARRLVARRVRYRPLPRAMGGIGLMDPMGFPSRLAGDNLNTIVDLTAFRFMGKVG